MGGEQRRGDGAGHQDEVGGGTWPEQLYIHIHALKPFVDVQ